MRRLSYSFLEAMFKGSAQRMGIVSLLTMANCGDANEEGVARNEILIERTQTERTDKSNSNAAPRENDGIAKIVKSIIEDSERYEQWKNHVHPIFESGTFEERRLLKMSHPEYMARYEKELATEAGKIFEKIHQPNMTYSQWKEAIENLDTKNKAVSSRVTQKLKEAYPNYEETYEAENLIKRMEELGIRMAPY